MYSDDQECFLLIKEDNQSGLALLYEKYRYYAYSIALSITRDYSESDDIVQDAFVEIWDHRRTLKPNQNGKAYLAQTVRHLSINYLKKQSETTCLSDEIVPAADNLQKTAESSVLLEQIGSLLSEDEIAIFYLHVVAGYSFLDISHLREVSLFSVAGTYRRSLNKIKAYQD
jgi:RNA polymerase sigma-70 factor, ECF subfamily